MTIAEKLTGKKQNENKEIILDYDLINDKAIVIWEAMSIKKDGWADENYGYTKLVFGDFSYITIKLNLK